MSAADTTWTHAVSNDFYTNGNWDTNAAPTAVDNVLILDPTVTAVINFTGSREIGNFHLGTTGETGGNVDFTAGQLVVSADTSAVPNRSHIGDQNSLNSKFVMRGTAVMLFDEPLDGAGAGFNSAGGGQDLEIGAQTGASGAKGFLELHDNAILRISDDLKIGAEPNGDAEVLIDGNAQISAGSGLSVSESNPSKGKLTVAGNALVVTGNSAGAGNAAQGFSDEGYLTLSANADSTADVIIKDSGKLYARTLQQRAGVTNMTIQDSGEFHVFDAFNFAAPNLGVASVAGTTAVRTSHMAQNNGSVFNLTISGNGKMSVDSAPDLGYKGLAMAGGNNAGVLTATGGAANIELRDNASFTIQQNLHMTAASSPDPIGASSKLRIVGPNVTARVNGDLYMSYDPILETANADPSTLNAVITGATHSTLQVGGEAKIEFGNLAVELSGFAPIGGETYTLISAGSIGGTDFLATDFTLAPLAAGLSWDVDVSATSVLLKVLGSAGKPGDYDADLDRDGADFLKWQVGGSPSPLSAGDLATWQANYGRLAVAAGQPVPEPQSVVLAGAALLAVAGLLRRR